MEPSPEQRKLFLLSGALKLTPEERHELAEYLLRRDCDSWATLTPGEVGRLLDALEGFGLVSHLIDSRG